MKTNLKGTIWIEGFHYKIKFIGAYCFYSENDRLFKIIYQGKTSEITERIARECVHIGVLTDNCKDYQSGFNTFETAKESILSACDQKYCIIYKTI